MVHHFGELLGSVRKWAVGVPFSPEILRNDADGLRFLWETTTYLAELIVCRGECSPYRCVSFQLLDLRRDMDQALVYCYHDREDSSTEEILAALNRGIEHMKERQEQYV